MADNSSIALEQSQATLHCSYKATLYPIDMTMGERIAAAMRRFDPPMKQVAIAQAFDLTAQAVSQWINDKDKPDWQKLPALARLLKVPCVWLIEGRGEPPAPEDPMVLFEALDDRDRRTVVEMMLAMARTREAAAGSAQPKRSGLGRRSNG